MSTLDDERSRRIEANELILRNLGVNNMIANMNGLSKGPDTIIERSCLKKKKAAQENCPPRRSRRLIDIPPSAAEGALYAEDTIEWQFSDDNEEKTCISQEVSRVHDSMILRVEWFLCLSIIFIVCHCAFGYFGLVSPISRRENVVKTLS